MLETHVAHTKPLSRMQSWSESLRGCKVTKPIFSAKRYKSLSEDYNTVYHSHASLILVMFG